MVILARFLAAPNAHAQAEPSDPNALQSFYLPIIWKGDPTVPTPTPTPAPSMQTKIKSGIHMGNRGSDWHPNLFTRLGRATDGAWPAAVVVQSDQLYNIQRATTGLCRVSDATVKQINDEDYELYTYLTEAVTEHGTIVVIRITPSPGNFDDYDDLGDNHVLLASEIPAGGDYCGGFEEQKTKVHQYRDILDIAKEMDAIYRLSVETHNWPKAKLFFEPANEPNYEWYEKFVVVDRIVNLAPKIDNKQAWIDMDNYFAALYDRAKQPDLNPNLQILTPPMAQGLYGEHFGIGTCNAWTLANGVLQSGFDYMKKTYGYDFDAGPLNQPPAKADGFSLHNYWRAGREAWDSYHGGISHDFICNYPQGIPDFQPSSDHLSQYFPDAMAVTMRGSGKPVFITEADLLSPCQQPPSSLTRKDRIPGDATDNPRNTSNSMLEFIRQEFWASYVIAWLLVNEFEAPIFSCTDDNPNDEINWHEAYLENGVEREWFGLWWPITP
jgi:hypothetical protein